MKFVLIIFSALLLAGGGAAGGYFFFQNQAVASAGPMDEIAKAREMKKAKNAKEEAKNLQFVKLEPLVLPILDNSGVSQVVTLVVALEVNNDQAAERAEMYAPRLKDAFIQDMYGVLNRKASLQGGVIKVDQLKARLNRVTTKVLGEHQVNDVLLQVVQQKPI
ncbi:MAG: flagellar basal body-associated FliL family protein [Alphaproteobacteria bacterium]|nr:flagellar basal body-associated FliL family protein [Alphaproteobacteria bacterium]